MTFNPAQRRDQLGRFGEMPKAESPQLNLADVDRSDPQLLTDAASPTLSDGQAQQMADPARPFLSRYAVALRPDSRCAQRAARDPDPVIRAQALAAGPLLGQGERTALEQDEQVRHVVAVLGR